MNDFQPQPKMPAVGSNYRPWPGMMPRRWQGHKVNAKPWIKGQRPKHPKHDRYRF